MNNKGFSLIELLGCLVLMGVILCIGLYSARGTLATTFSSLTNVSENEIYTAARSYVVENNVTWNKTDDEYTCLTVNNLVDDGYFDLDDVTEFIDRKIKVVRNSQSKVINNVNLVDVCE